MLKLLFNLSVILKHQIVVVQSIQQILKPLLGPIINFKHGVVL